MQQQTQAQATSVTAWSCRGMEPSELTELCIGHWQAETHSLTANKEAGLRNQNNIIYYVGNIYDVPGTELLFYSTQQLLSRSYHPISQMRKLRYRAFTNLYNSKPPVKAEVTFEAKVHQF